MDSSSLQESQTNESLKLNPIKKLGSSSYISNLILDELKEGTEPDQVIKKCFEVEISPTKENAKEEYLPSFQTPNIASFTIKASNFAKNILFGAYEKIMGYFKTPESDSTVSTNSIFE